MKSYRVHISFHIETDALDVQDAVKCIINKFTVAGHVANDLDITACVIEDIPQASEVDDKFLYPDGIYKDKGDDDE